MRAGSPQGTLHRSPSSESAKFHTRGKWCRSLTMNSGTGIMPIIRPITQNGAQCTSWSTSLVTTTQHQVYSPSRSPGQWRPTQPSPSASTTQVVLILFWSHLCLSTSQGLINLDLACSRLSPTPAHPDNSCGIFSLKLFFSSCYSPA